MSVSEELLGPIFRVNVEVTCSSETFMCIFEATQCHISEDYCLSLKNDFNRYSHFLSSISGWNHNYVYPNGGTKGLCDMVASSQGDDFSIFCSSHNGKYHYFIFLWLVLIDQNQTVWAENQLFPTLLLLHSSLSARSSPVSHYMRIITFSCMERGSPSAI
jgi:hypothetical protein